MDVTERKRPEEARAYLAAIIASSGDAIVGKTLDSVITSWNEAAERMFGYTAAEAVGQQIYLIIPPERHGEEGQIIERLRRGERIEHHPAGRTQPVPPWDPQRERGWTTPRSLARALHPPEFLGPQMRS